jgi:transposase
VRQFLRRHDGPTQLAARHLFRLLLIGYFEGIDSERGIAWRPADSLTLRDVLCFGLAETPQDHSTISRTRRRDLDPGYRESHASNSSMKMALSFPQ